MTLGELSSMQQQYETRVRTPDFQIIRIYRQSADEMDAALRETINRITDRRGGRLATQIDGVVGILGAVVSVSEYYDPRCEKLVAVIVRERWIDHPPSLSPQSLSEILEHT